MSAFITIVKAQSVELLSSTAAFDKAGIVRVLDHRQVVWPGHGAAMYVRGEYREAETVASVLAHYAKTVAEIAENIVPAMKEASGLFDLALVGWSADRPVGFYFSTFSHSGFDSGRLYDLAQGDFYAGPDRSYDAYAEIVPDPQSFDASTQAIPAFEAMRPAAMTYARTTAADGFHGFGVGGSIERTVIRRDGMATSILHTWPDRIGTPINPFMEAA